MSSASRTAIVTGASSGNGRAIARRLAEDGINIVCADVSPSARSDGFEDDLDLTTDEAIRRSGGQAIFVECDVTSIHQIEGCITAAVESFGSADILVNNAGVFTGLATIFDETEEAFDQAVAVNLKGVWNGCKAMATHLRDHGQPGRIINIASVGGLVGIGNEPGYCATKGGVVNMTRAVALDCAEHRIAVNAVCPGFIVTGMVREFVEQPEVLDGMRAATPWPRFGKPEDVAEVCAFLAREAAEWMTGAVIAVDGGFTAK
jgi:NAD(P)-dependent dehydrogenase (short-subunit alcohol dehydrogenase family)